MNTRDRGSGDIVYSTDGGWVRPAANDGGRDRPAGGGAHRHLSPPPRPGFPSDGVVRVSRERGGRGGKIVTVVHGLPVTPGLDALAADLKRLCGAGGTVRGTTVEVQGDHRDRIAQRLRALGHTVKIAGG